MLKNSLLFLLLALAGSNATALSQDDISQPGQEGSRRRGNLMNRLSPEARKIVEDNFNAYRHLTPEERRFLHRNFVRWESLTPERQEKLRQNYRRFLRMNPEQRARFLEKYREWKRLTPEEREQLRSRGKKPGVKHLSGQSPKKN